MSIWAGIKKAINSNLSKPLNTLIEESKDSLDTKITDYLGNSTYGLSALKTLMTGGKIPIVKSVQRGTSGSTSDSEITISINTVKPDKCIVILDYSSRWTDTTYAYYEGVYLYSLASTTLQIRSKNGIKSSVSVSWQVIEFY